MVPERFERYIGSATRAKIAGLAGVADDGRMQDWPLEVADPSRLDEFIDLHQCADSDDDRFALMELVLYSLDEADAAQQRAAWRVIEPILERDPVLYAREILYWSLGNESEAGAWKMDDLREDEAFALTPLMRPVLIRVAHRLGLRLT